MTSSAVTGSFAITSFGLHARAIAIITRCRMPPENSCGKSRRRSRLIPTSSKSSPTRSIASSSSTFSWRMIGSAICWPMFRTGFREFIAPWKMIEMSFQRTFRIRMSEALMRSRPRNTIEPEMILPLYGRRRIRARAVVVFPHPLSPARPRASPSSRSNETPSTACTGPDSVAYSITRSLTSRSRSLSPPQPRIQDFVEGEPEQVEPEHKEDETEAGDDKPPDVASDHECAAADRLVDHFPPAHRVVDGQPQKREDGFRQD